MNKEVVQTICNIIILLGGVAGAITTILALCGRPIKFFKKRRDYLEKQHRDEIVKDVSTLVNKEIVPKLDEIHQQNIEQNEDIQVLTTTMRNSIGAEILAFYEAHKAKRAMTESEKDAVEDLYRAYKNIDGNHYVDRIYERMTTWTILDEEGNEIHNVVWWKPEKK